MADARERLCCPRCRGEDIEALGVIVAYDPRAYVVGPDESFEPEQVQRKYVCRGCGTSFTVDDRRGG